MSSSGCGPLEHPQHNQLTIIYLMTIGLSNGFSKVAVVVYAFLPVIMSVL